MQIFYLNKKIPRYRNAVVAMGVFDGVHRGHLRVLSACVEKAKKIKGKSVALTFWPHPRQKQSLTSLEHRLKLIEACGISACIIVDFNPAFAHMSAQDFINNILIKKIGARFIYVGKNFRFGRHAAGDFALLKKYAAGDNFKVKGFAVKKFRHQPISSTVIREAIKNGDLKSAEKLLGRRVSVLGSVVRGSALGRKMDVPTANINPHHEVIPPAGIYVVRVLFEGHVYQGVCYIGSKPTLSAKSKIHIEVNLFNFSKNIYGKYLEIEFLKFIRKDKKFSSLQVLSEQIKKDILRAKEILS